MIEAENMKVEKNVAASGRLKRIVMWILELRRKQKYLELGLV